MSSDAEELRKELIFQLRGGNAHAKFEDAVDSFPAKLRGTVPENLPYSAWQLLEHLRIAQADILKFSDNADGSYKEMTWPDAYWPKSPAPASASAWDKSVQQVLDYRERFIKLLQAGDLFAPFPWGDGQTLLREAVLIVDHNAYHIGELVAVRRLLKAWPAKK